MAPTVKDVENPTSTNSSALPSAQVANPPQAAPARSQPIPLEVPVSVNGARTVEGSDKREPFSESTKTVLVFANGAVIRLASSVAPGQLLFVTNDKTKKEVVCQVVKSKNYRTVTGYVELEFTESAPGFWGVRIPTESAPVGPAPPKAPAPQRPVAPPAAISPAIGTPKVVAPAPPAPVVATQTPAAEPSARPAGTPLPATAAVTPRTETAAPAIQPVAPAAPKTDSLPAQLAAQFAALAAKESVVAPSQPPATEAAKPSVAEKSGDSSTEELRQQTARLQEQLSSLLFRESATEKTAVPPPTSVPPVIVPPPVNLVPKEMLRGADVLEKAVAELESSGKPESKVEPIKVSPVTAPVAEIKTPPVASKSSSIALPVEEVKIPSWLAPLARETETAKESSTQAQSSATSAEQTFSRNASEDVSSDISGDASHKTQAVVFGGQLLGAQESTEVQTSSSGSKKGLIFGLVAAAALVAAVGWYGLQPGNFLASKPAVASLQNNSAAASQPFSKPDASVGAPVSTPNSANSTPSSSPTGSRSAATTSAAQPPAESNRAANSAATSAAPNSANATAHNVPEVEAPKKPVFGDVRLATPNVNRSANSTGSEVAPSIEAGEAAGAAEPLVGLAAGHHIEPTAPLPVGGDVKPAHLLKAVPPIYPPAARSQRISGDVQLDALIDASGVVTATKIISGPTLLHQSAIFAVKRWKYEPAQLDGKPTSMHLTVTVQFRLQ